MRLKVVGRVFAGWGKVQDMDKVKNQRAWKVEDPNLDKEEMGT